MQYEPRVSAEDTEMREQKPLSKLAWVGFAFMSFLVLIGIPGSILLRIKQDRPQPGPPPLELQHSARLPQLLLTEENFARQGEMSTVFITRKDKNMLVLMPVALANPFLRLSNPEPLIRSRAEIDLGSSLVSHSYIIKINGELRWGTQKEFARFTPEQKEKAAHPNDEIPMQNGQSSSFTDKVKKSNWNLLR